MLVLCTYLGDVSGVVTITDYSTETSLVASAVTDDDIDQEIATNDTEQDSSELFDIPLDDEMRDLEISVVRTSPKAIEEASDSDDSDHMYDDTINLLKGKDFILNTSTPHLNTSGGHLSMSTGHLNISTGHLDTSTGHLNTSTGQLNTPIGHLNTSTGHLNTSTGHLNTSSGHLNASQTVLSSSSAYPEVRQPSMHLPPENDDEYIEDELAG